MQLLLLFPQCSSSSTFLKKHQKLLLLILLISICALATLFQYEFTKSSFNDQTNLSLTPAVLDISPSELSTWKLKESLSIADYINLSDLESFLWKPRRPDGFQNLKSRFCDHNVQVVILVASAPKNFVQRSAIRETWGSRSNLIENGVRLVFVLGTTETKSTENSILLEVVEHDDIVQENFVDHYHNLTLKSMAMLKWINLTCNLETKNTALSGPSFILKTDDDVFINVKQLVNVSRNAAPNSSMMGTLTCDCVPVSDPKSSYYMPKYMYSSDLFPCFLPGPGYMIRTKFILPLLQQSVNTPLVHLEDVYVTGILSKKINLHPENSFYFFNGLSNPEDLCLIQTRVNSHHLKPQELRYIWSQRNLSLSC